jgi:pSer/pThr/pTyr-binding forkhead associated (FHA) protein
MRLILEVLTGPKAGEKITAQAGQVVRIGRTAKAAVAIDDTFMSGQHFAIECVGGACGVRDLESRNGTQLNDERITRAVLRDGDRIHAGKTDFLVHIELDEVESDPAQSSQLKATLPPTLPPASRDEFGSKAPPAPSKKESDRLVATPESRPDSKPLRSENHRAATPSAGLVQPETGMGAYEAATPQGTLLRILRSRPERLMALVDATRDKHVLELLESSGEEYYSLYRSEQNAALAPHLVRLPPQSTLLRQMIEEGWGRSWGLYLTCNASPIELREYFRNALMVRMPDGMEMFSRFYDPRFFRSFLETCTVDEAKRYFGPISAYLMESERSEILLEFTRSSQGTEKKGHLLSILE